jgi:tRNA-dihydrouridine synthase B
MLMHRLHCLLMLPWFQGRFPLYLAPMAGVTDVTFRRLCKEFGADVLVTEFVSAEGILHRNRRTSEYLAFGEAERPVGVQLFGAEPDHLAEAARAVVDWVRPDFIDINFGCPVNKVVSRNGGSALLRDCPLLERVARAVVQAVPGVPVTAKIRIGWDQQSINAVTTAKLLEEAGIQALAVHGRTKDQGYSGQADWDVIGQVAETVKIPVIGNGDITTAHDVVRRESETKVAGVMIGRAAMAYPWIFREIKAFQATGMIPPEPSMEERWAFILRHCRMTVQERGIGNEIPVMHSMRARLMAYCKGLPGGRILRTRLQHASTISDVEAVAALHLSGKLGEDEDLREAALHAER